MSRRVQCERCQAHRDLAIAPRCLVCGAERYTAVEPTVGDVDAIAREVIAAAELVDLALHDAGVQGLDAQHPAARQLRDACRTLARTRAGRFAA